MSVDPSSSPNEGRRQLLMSLNNFFKLLIYIKLVLLKLSISTMPSLMYLKVGSQQQLSFGQFHPDSELGQQIY